MDIESPIAPCMLLHYLVKHYCQQNKPLKTSPHLKYVATLHCNLLLMACFKSSVATYARCGGIFNTAFNYKFTKESSSEKKFKSVKI